MELPAVSHFLKVGKNLSELGASFTSAVRMVPSGIRVQPSSALKSALPGGLPWIHTMVLGLSTAMFFTSLLPIRKSPLGSIEEGESPMYDQPGGGWRGVQTLVLGL